MATPTKTFVEEASALGQRATREGQELQAVSSGFTPPHSSHGTGTEAQPNWVAGTFTDRASAERAYNSMLSRGYDEKEINLIMSDETRKMYFSEQNANDVDHGNKAIEGAGVGGAIGMTAGAILAAVAAIGTSIAIPGLGLVIAGPIALALAGAGAGAVTGGMIGTLIGWGIPEERAKLYESDLKSGGILLGVSPHNDADAAYFEGQWKEYNGRNVYR